MPRASHRLSIALVLVAVAGALSEGCSCIVASTLDDKEAGPSTDGLVDFDCTGLVNGTPCGERLICISGRCMPSSCGDGFIDMAAGEQCEDLNEMTGDGCEPETCTFTCEDAMQCDDGNVCDGAEACDAMMHRCMTGTPAADGSECVRDAPVPAGVCRMSLCVPVHCGDGTPQPEEGEDCDDGNNTDGDGCDTDCESSCSVDEDCSDGDICTGVETCSTTVPHTCLSGAAMDCADSDACTADTCDPKMGCVNALIDADADGFAPTSLGACGTDCDDANNTRYPGASESSCDAIDSNCDGSTTDGTATIACYRDADADGYGRMDVSMSACTCPVGWVPERPAGFDCYDGSSSGSIGASVHPGQTMYFTSAYSTCPACRTSFDYDCDGASEQLYTRTGVSGCSEGRGTGLCSSPGWTGTTVPSCGASAEFQSCARICLPTCACFGTRGSRTQSCH